MPQYHLNGINIWFATLDAPAPLGIVIEVTPAITVAVSADVADPVVNVRYRRAGGPWLHFMLQRGFNTAAAIYFQGRFPETPAGSRIEYVVLFRSGGVRPRPETTVGEINTFEVALQQQGTPLASAIHATGLTETSADTSTLHSPANPANIADLPMRLTNRPEGTVLNSSTLPPGALQLVQSFAVQGRVLDATGTCLIGYIVRAFDRDMRTEQLLGEAITDATGHYAISYTAMQFHRLEKGSADLIVRVMNVDGAVLTASPILFNVSSNMTVNLIVGDTEYRQPSEYEHLVATITPLLEDVPIVQLIENDEHQDITFLTHESGQDRQHIIFLIEAHRIHVRTDLPTEVFYGLFRMGLPTNLSALLTQSQEVQRRALENAIQNYIIPAKLQDQLDIVLRQLHARNADAPIFLTKPAVLFANPTNVADLSLDQTAFISTRLNDQLRSEILKSIGPISEPMTTSVQLALAHIDYRQFPNSDVLTDHSLILDTSSQIW